MENKTKILIGSGILTIVLMVLLSGCIEQPQPEKNQTMNQTQVPGLCDEYSSCMLVDNSTVLCFSSENSTYYYFDPTTNELIETFVNPRNSQAEVEHRFKYYYNYTKESWYVLNHNYENNHEYYLTIPLFAFGDAVYLHHYSNVTSNQTGIDVSTDYLIFYDSATGTNGNVTIYTFSSNMTILNFGIVMDGLTKIVMAKNYTLAPRSGESNQIYVSTVNGSGMSFDEIYNEFAQQIIDNEDSLTSFYIEGQHDKISYYKPGDTLQKNIIIFNNGASSETRTLNITIIQPIIAHGVNYSDKIIYNKTETITINSKTEEIVGLQYQIPNNLQEGTYIIRVTDGINKAETIFIVQPAFNITIDMPQNVIQGEEFTFNCTIKNALNRTINGINTTLDLNSYFNTSESLTKNIGTLASNGSITINWKVNVSGFASGYLPITIDVNSADGISDTQTKYINVLKLPILTVIPEASSGVHVNTPFELQVIVKNQGDLSISGISVKLFLPANVTTSESLTKSVGNLSGGETKLMNWTITSAYPDDFALTVMANDSTSTYRKYGSEIVYVIGEKFLIKN